MLTNMRRAALCFSALALTAASIHAQWTSANPRRAPTRYVGKMVSFYRGGAIKFGSGTLVGPRHVLTAGHTIVHRERLRAGQPAREWHPVAITFTPGLDGGRAPNGSANATRWTVSNRFLHQGDNDRDIGLFQLNRNLGVAGRGYARMREWPNGWRLNVRVVGYAGNSETPSRSSFRAENISGLWSLGHVRRSWHRWWSVRHSRPGLGGASGGAVFNGRDVVGVFTGGERVLGRLFYLSGTRLSHTPLHNEIRAWIRRFP